MIGAVGSTLALALVVALFFAGCFVACSPYRALHPDLLRGLTLLVPGFLTSPLLTLPAIPFIAFGGSRLAARSQRSLAGTVVQL